MNRHNSDKNYNQHHQKKTRLSKTTPGYNNRQGVALLLPHQILLLPWRYQDRSWAQQHYQHHPQTSRLLLLPIPTRLSLVLWQPPKNRQRPAAITAKRQQRAKIPLAHAAIEKRKSLLTATTTALRPIICGRQACCPPRLLPIDFSNNEFIGDYHHISIIRLSSSSLWK